MAIANLELIHALRVTAARLRSNTSYQWGHMGVCNCGHLAQTVTRRTPAEIHSAAMVRAGDWEQQAQEYCPTSGFAIDDIIESLLALGMSVHDIGRLEKLSDSRVLARLPGEPRYLRHNQRDNVILYMETWADLLEAELPARARVRAA